MTDRSPVHGGTDAGPRPRHDLSTNANPLGPNPAVLDALRDVDVAPYPDPSATAAREALARLHAAHPDEVVVGAGASELVHRVVRSRPGPVLMLPPAFGEYEHAARVAGRGVVRARSVDEVVDRLPDVGVAVLALPNNPDGRLLSAEEAIAVGRASATAGVPVVVDLAYQDLCEAPVRVPPGAWRLHAPNKAHGTTGLRAGYLLAPAADAARLRAAAPSWVLSAHADAFLRTIATPQAQAFVARTRPLLWRWRDQLADDLQRLGCPVRSTPATWVLAEVGDAAAVAAAVRRRTGVKVRDATSFGLPTMVRVAAGDDDARAALVAGLADVLAEAA